MRFLILLATLVIAAHSGPAMAQKLEDSAVCTDGQQPIERYRNWSENSDAICNYGFVEANRLLAGVLEASSGGVNLAWLKRALGIPRFVQRKGYEPNGFFVVNAGYQVAPTGQDGWEMVIEAYERCSKGAWGRKDVFDVKFHGTGRAPQMESENRGRCISEAAVLDRAIAAGWRYVPGTIVSGTAGPAFWVGALSTDDGRSLVLVNLSRTSELPPCETLEATCAWIAALAS